VIRSKTDFDKTGILHLYARRPISRVLTGDFHGDGYDQTCLVLDDGSLECHGISTDRRELWWWFTQGNFVGSNDDAIVGDFDGDRRDDILVYNRSGGAYRMYSVKGDHFFNATPQFSQGNLSGVATANIRLRAGDFNGDGRDDIMAVNSWGQVLYYTSVFDGANHTFWWAFTTRSGFVSGDDQVLNARIDDNAADDVVLRNRVTGATRLYGCSTSRAISRRSRA
jgi:FG-GAP-like repeat